ncbi:cytochrome P450 [Xylogone sp. PMI_703]|nr:cytochrome P450 [Xylogone sp. PMI_703]
MSATIQNNNLRALLGVLEEMEQSLLLADNWPWLVCSLIAISIVYGVVKFIRHRRFYADLPSPQHSMILGNLKVMGEALKKYPSDFHPMPLFTELGQQYGYKGLYYMDLYPFSEPMVCIIDPEVAAQVQNSPNFYRHPFASEFLGGIVGKKSIFTTNGAEWHQQRSWFAPAFSTAQILTLVPGMIEETLVFREILTKNAVSGEVFSMNDKAMRLAIDVIGRSVGNIRLHSQTQYSLIQDAFMQAIGWTAGQTEPLWKKILSPVMMNWYTRKLDRDLSKVIRDRYASRADDGPTKTILDLALKGYQKDHGKISAAGRTADQDKEFMQIALDNAKTFFAGGHDTTASLITYTYHYLSMHPEILKRVRAEHDEVVGATLESTLQKLEADPHILNKLPLTLAVFREVLRLHSAGFTIRKGVPGATVTFQGRTYPMDNHMIAILASSMARDPELWNSPDPSITVQDFYPDRWFSPKTYNLAAWQAFEKGPRNCIGQQLAIVEAKVIMLLTLRWFDFQAVFKEGGKGVTEIKGWGGRAYQELKLTAKPKDGIPMRVKLVERNN